MRKVYYAQKNAPPEEEDDITASYVSQQTYCIQPDEVLLVILDVTRTNIGGSSLDTEHLCVFIQNLSLRQRIFVPQNRPLTQLFNMGTLLNMSVCCVTTRNLIRSDDHISYGSRD